VTEAFFRAAAFDCSSVKATRPYSRQGSACSSIGRGSDSGCDSCEECRRECKGRACRPCRPSRPGQCGRADRARCDDSAGRATARSRRSGARGEEPDEKSRPGERSGRDGLQELRDQQRRRSGEREEETVEWACKPGSVGSDHFSGMPIARHLKRPTRRSSGTGPVPAALKRPPSVWPCSGWGLPGQPGHPGCRCALTAPFHPYLILPQPVGTGRRQAIGGIFSAALSLVSRPVGVTDHPVLWSPDFPPRSSAGAELRSDHSAHSTALFSALLAVFPVFVVPCIRCEVRASTAPGS